MLFICNGPDSLLIFALKVDPGVVPCRIDRVRDRDRDRNRERGRDRDKVRDRVRYC